MLDVEPMWAVGVIDEPDGEVPLERGRDEAPDRLVEVRNLILPGPHDEQRNLLGEICGGLPRARILEVELARGFGNTGERRFASPSPCRANLCTGFISLSETSVATSVDFTFCNLANSASVSSSRRFHLFVNEVNFFKPSRIWSSTSK